MFIASGSWRFNDIVCSVRQMPERHEWRKWRQRWFIMEKYNADCKWRRSDIFSKFHRMYNHGFVSLKKFFLILSTSSNSLNKSWEKKTFFAFLGEVSDDDMERKTSTSGPRFRCWCDAKGIYYYSIHSDIAVCFKEVDSPHRINWKLHLILW